MLSKIEIRNFRNFKDWYDVDFRSSSNYEFNSEAVHDGIIRHGIIFGKNGSGKSNLGLAILDIISHIQDAKQITSLRDNYTNADSASSIAEFKYYFKFGDSNVKYSYGKETFTTTIYETLEINGQEVIKYDKRKSFKAEYNLAGTESLKRDFEHSNISVVKYVSANSVLDQNDINSVFNQFIKFVMGMIYFRTLTKQADYHGPRVDTQRLSSTIIKADKLDDFEQFLNLSGIDCKLAIGGPTKDPYIEFVFEHRNYEFGQIASTGTLALGHFYYWWLKLDSNELTFAYVDEFDAYYHHALARSIVEKINTVGCQTFLTTHNTGILSNELLRPDCYFEMFDNFVGLNKLVTKELRQAHNLEKIYKSLNHE